MDTNLKTGDLLYRSKGLVEHTGVYIGNGQVVHNSPNSGIEIVDFYAFSEGQTVKIMHTDANNIHLLQDRLWEILNSRNGYSVSLNNCEHIANLMVHGRAYSPQFKATLIGSIAAGFLAWNAGDKNWFWYVLGGGVAGCLISNLYRSYDAKVTPNIMKPSFESV
jgi:hypothetical protein